MIFLSHNHNDKPLVEMVAYPLSTTFGQPMIFYDSWSIQPGDGIIDKMSDALQQCTHFFFFVTKNSLQSRMVSLEWQNALVKATNGKCQFFAIRCDDSDLPAILLQNRYIDLYNIGLDAAYAEIVDVVRGKNTFRTQDRPPSNLCFKIESRQSSLLVHIRARFFAEPTASFAFITSNPQSDFQFAPQEPAMFMGGFTENVIRGSTGEKVNVASFTIPRALTPTTPLCMEVSTRSGVPVSIQGVLHFYAQDQYRNIEPDPDWLARMHILRSV